MIPILLALTASLSAPLVIAPADPGVIEVDAFFDEWDRRPAALAETVVSGQRGGRADLSARINVAFDDHRLYLAAQVVDDKFVPGGATEGDRLVFAFTPTGDAHGGPRRIQIVLNTLEVRPPTVEVDGKHCPGCKAVGTMRRDGWAVEASVPLLGLPVHTWGPLRFAAIIHDADSDPTTPDAVIATDPVTADLAPKTIALHLDPLLALEEGRRAYESDRGRHKPLASLVADVAGDSFPEEVRVTDDDIALIGRDLPDRAAYLYFQHGWRSGAKLVDTELKNLDGAPGDELLVRHTEWSVPREVEVEIIEIYGVHDGFLKRRFAAKVGTRFVGKGSATSAFEVRRAQPGKPRPLRVGVATLDGLARADYYDPDHGVKLPAQAQPMPWSRKKPVDYVLKGESWQPSR